LLQEEYQVTDSYAWLEWLYGTEPQGLLWIGGQQDGWAGRCFTTIEDAVAYARTFHSGGVYHRLTTLREITHGRGAGDDSAYLPAFSMDLDLKGPGHKALNYPNTEEDLKLLLGKAGLPEPTAWVHSGGGRYPYWKLDQPADLTIPGELERADALSKRLHKHVIAWANELGWKVDNTSDLARVYRLPGTLNRKTEQHVMCHVQSNGGPLHTLEELEHALSVARIPHTEEQEPAGPFVTGSQLFDQPSTDTSHLGHTYTLEQALSFVRPKIEELKRAQDGEINVKLVAAAMTLAHFGAEFWDRAAAERQLLGALEATVYDGATWRAEDTIERAYRDMGMKVGPEYWRAALVKPTLETPQPTGGRLRKAMLKRSAIHALPDPVPLIKDVLYRNSVTVLSGKFGTYKSFVAISWACALATGQDWMGHETPAAVPVIYAAAEGAYGLKRRIDAWERAHSTVPDTLYLIPISVRLNRPEDMRELEELIVETGAQVLVFDTLHASTPGVDENDAGEMGNVMDVLRGLQERHGLCSILPHHTGHAGERARGSSSVEDDADTTFVIRLDGEDRGPEAKRTMVHRKTKDGALLPDVELKLELVDGTGSGHVTTSDAWERSQDERPVDHGQARAIKEPQAWTMIITRPDAEVQRQILQTLADVAGTVGITQGDVLSLVAGKWYEGKTGRRPGQLNKETFKKAWTRSLMIQWAEGTVVESGSAGPSHYVIQPDWYAENVVTGQ
jgi:hypothetical protein